MDLNNLVNCHWHLLYDSTRYWHSGVCCIHEFGFNATYHNCYFFVQWHRFVWGLLTIVSCVYMCVVCLAGRANEPWLNLDIASCLYVDTPEAYFIIYSDWVLVFCNELEISELGRIMRSKVLKTKIFIFKGFALKIHSHFEHEKEINKLFYSVSNQFERTKYLLDLSDRKLKRWISDADTV